jgi:hypothetical protein
MIVRKEEGSTSSIEKKLATPHRRGWGVITADPVSSIEDRVKLRDVPRQWLEKNSICGALRDHYDTRFRYKLHEIGRRKENWTSVCEMLQ